MVKFRQRKCKECGERYEPERQLQNTCSVQCAIAKAKKQEQKKREELERRRKKDNEIKQKLARDKLKARKLAVKPPNYFKKQAQQSFNEFIRLRDHREPCISCGEINPPDLHGGQWDCGHFLSVGSHPELRFEEKNAYKQCKSCNAGAGKFARKNSTVSQQYEENLIAKFGRNLVDWLRGPREMTNYRKDDFIRIKDYYRAKARELKRKLGIKS
ncbi:recombination protein NinG [Xenorhabdus anantnagensis]|uniref:Recombination protein NinG n=1 Tax=Xenorhabdus anantnagensis TaxID=3025875 RepID=A0ABT5LX14_9GAMM|nr:recombination protein NinG [Xenorhabdus anantnagensis]